MNMVYKFLSILLIFNCSAEEITYTSQWCSKQDEYLNNNIFKNKRNGVFVDIGAHDGKSYSNTYFFEKALGWSGICIEPISNVFEKLKKNRNCVCINACISDIEGTVPFVLVHDHSAFDKFFNMNMLSGILSTYGKKGLKGLKTSINLYGSSYSIVKMPSRILNNILKENNIKKIDYLSIDTEGAELQILKSINFDVYKIYVMSVENNYRNPEIRKFLESKKFTFLTNLNQDEIYINYANA